MKKFITLISVLMLAGLFALNANAQEKEELLWLMGEEVVKPEMIEQYYEVSQELVEFCKAENFPYAFYVWVSQPFHYSLAYPLEEMNDITKMEEAWKALLEKWGEEKYQRFQECIETQNEKVMVGLMDFSYVPESGAENEEENNYCYWQEITVKKGSEKAFEEVLKKAVGLMTEKGSELATYVGKGKTGYDLPLYFAWYYGKDQMDFLEKEKKFGELMGDDWKEINSHIIKHIKGIKNVDFWYAKELSYPKAE
jgi:hypothetical protein